MSIYVPNNHIISELSFRGNLLTSPKTAPLCLRQVLVVRMSVIQISCGFKYQIYVAYTANGEFRYDFFAGDLSLLCGIAFRL